MIRHTIANIDCLVAGPDKPSAGTLLCLHGIGGDHASFLPQLQGLSGECRVVISNMPGYGKSPSMAPLSFASLALSLRHLITELAGGPVHIMGQSIGGMLAQELFHRYPESVKSLILVATTSAFGGRDDTFKSAFLHARLKPLDEGMSMADIAQQAMPSIVGANTDTAVVQSAIDSMSAVPVASYREVLKCLVTFNRRHDWSSIQCPVLLLAGSEDTNAPAATMKKMADKLPHAEFQLLEGAGHLVNLERGAVVNDLTLRFIKRVNGTT